MYRFIGDKKFYKMVFAILIPIVIQTGFTTFVSLLDNIFIGRIGTLEMSAVSIVNQLLMIYNLSIFGSLGGPGIFCSQYFGNNDHEGARFCFRYKLMVVVSIACVGLLIFTFFQDTLIGLYLNPELNSPSDIERTLGFAKDYLGIMMIGMVPFAITNAVGSMLKEDGETKQPMYASVTAVVVNCCLNAVLIFGLLGFPALGVKGAAIATVISRFVEMSFLIYSMYANRLKHLYLQGAFTSLYVPKELTKKMTIKGIPLLLNELLWSSGQAINGQSLSLFGISAIASFNICNTIAQFFMIVCYAMGSAIAIIVGQKLGAGEIEEAKIYDYRLFTMSVASALVMGSVFVLCSPYIVQIYNVDLATKEMAVNLMKIYGMLMPIYAICHASFFTIRSGGNTLITFAFDSGFMWLISVPVCRILVIFTSLTLPQVYLCTQSLEIIKVVIGLTIIVRGKWAKNIVSV